MNMETDNSSVTTEQQTVAATTKNNSTNAVSTEQAQEENWKAADIHANMAKVTNVKKNKGMSYFGANVQNASKDDLKKIRKKFNKYAEERHVDVAPPAYYDSIQYDHRRQAYMLADPTNSLYNHDQSSDTVMAKYNDDISYDVYSNGDINRIFRLGDFFSIIPPEYINIHTKTSGTSIQPIRQSGSLKINNGYSNKSITVSLVLNGMNQINGYEVSSPFDYNYHVDGLRNLISQMRYTPFMPVENTVLNIVHGVDNVALRSIYVETVPGFPETLQVALSLQEFNATPYTRVPNEYFDNMIDWDLYRWYTQLPLKDLQEGEEDKEDANYAYRLKKIETPQLTNKFKIGILTQSALDKAYIDNIEYDADGKPIGTEYEIENKTIGDDPHIYVNVYDEKNYENFISDEDEIELIKLGFTMSNTMPVIQLSAHESPTMQFLGTSDVEFQLYFETKNSYIAAKFNELNKQNNTLIRNNRFKNGIGFMKLENELVQLTGIKFVTINEINVNTVKNFPGLYEINIACTSYDSPKKDKEKLIGFNPFINRKGTRDDLISMTPKGYINKVAQDATAMVKLQELEMYPDLHLPTYAEADIAIQKIKAFRVKNNLIETLPYDTFPRHKCTSPLSKEEIPYEGFLDPDFYVSTIFAFSDVGTGGEDITDSFSNPDLVPDVATEPKYTVGYEPTKARVNQGFLNLWENKGEETAKNNQTQSIGTAITSGTSLQGAGVYMPTQVNKKTGNVFIDLVCDRVDANCGYSMDIDKRGGKIVNGRQYFDCSSLVSYGLMALGVVSYFMDTNALETVGVAIDKSQLQPGDIVIRHGSGSDGHAAVYLGNGKVAEASTYRTEPNLKYGNLERSKAFNVFRRVPNLQELSDKFLKEHPGFYGGSTNSSNTVSSNNDSTVSSNSDSTTSSGIGVGGAAVSMVAQATQTGVGASASKVTQLVNESSTTVIDANYDFTNQDLKMKTKIDAAQIDTFLNNILSGKNTIMSGFGATIIEASNQSGLDPAYLVAHAAEETGWGTSSIVKSKFNWFGIGAFDDSPGQSAYTFNNAKDGFIEGAKWIAKNYYEGQYQQTTLIKMRDPRHRYATNPSWPSNIASIMKTFHQKTNCWEMVNGGMLNGAGGSSYFDTSNPYGYSKEMFTNPNSGNTHGDSVSNINIDSFGTDYMEKIADLSNGNFDYSDINKSIQEANDKDHVVEYMYKDTMQYNMQGLFVRAFPSYLLVFLDEQADWVDRKKLWTNYYVSRSAIDINIHESDNTPIAVAQVQLTNFNGNLTRLKCHPSTSNLAFDDDEHIKKWIYDQTGTIFDEEITDKMIEYKNVLYDDLTLSQGARVHIRLGYGSDPLRYPISFNGSITELDAGEVVTFSAQSDGGELTNQPLTDKTNNTNKDIKLGVEVSNIIAHMLVARESGFLYAFSKGFFKYKSKYGIEHFGLHVGKVDEFEQALEDCNSKIIKGGGYAIGGIFGLAIGGPAGLGIGAGIGTTLTNTDVGDAVGAYIATVEKFALSLSNPISLGKFVFDIFDNNMDYHQYDILKNIYKGNYEGVPFTKSPYNPFDGEYNYRFLCQGKTVWDAMKMCEKAVPEFVAFPRYYNFESRMFFGLPSWLCKYESVIDDNCIYERAKSFAQAHIITSLDSIIENGIKLNAKGHNTNMIGLYSLGGDITTTPVVMSDRNIDWSKQSARTLDTTSVQDFYFVPGIIDKLLSWTGMYDNGKQLAINTCVSELMTSWCRTYAGRLTIIGQPEIRAYDYVYLNDDFLHMNGAIKARAVTQSLSVGTGLTTVITPGLIASNTLKQSGTSNVMRSFVQTSREVANLTSCVKAACAMHSAYKNGTAVIKAINMFKGTANFVNGIGKEAWRMFKTLEVVTKGKEYLMEIKSIATVASKVKSVATVIKGFRILQTIELGIKAVSIVFPPSVLAIMAIDALLNIFLTWVYDMFAYNNTINLYPLITTTKRYGTRPYCANITGQKTLLPGYRKDDLATSQQAEYYEESAEDYYEN